jgi:sugar phosphate isomerase/epimerase
LKTDVFLTTAKATSFTSLGLPFETVISHLHDYGYDGIELVTEDTSAARGKELRKIAEDNNLEIVATPSALVREKFGLTFADLNKEKRKKAVKKFNSLINFAHAINAKMVTVGLVRGYVKSKLPESKAWANMIECIKSCGEFAEDLGITLVVEPENRYEVGYIHTIDEGLSFVEKVNLDSVKLMIDTFHMNIEEDLMSEPIKKAAKQLTHVHIADSNRCAPGMGHINFPEIIETLKSCGYQGYLGFEISPRPDPLVAAERSVQYVKRIL